LKPVLSCSNSAFDDWASAVLANNNTNARVKVKLDRKMRVHDQNRHRKSGVDMQVSKSHSLNFTMTDVQMIVRRKVHYYYFWPPDCSCF